MPIAALSTTIPSAAMRSWACDSPLGNGHVRLAGDLPWRRRFASLFGGAGSNSRNGGLNALRTVRSGVDPGLEAPARPAAR